MKNNKNKMKRNVVKGFTLVELLAVIVVLAIILVIAVPKVMSVIEDATKASFESSAKMVASQVENQYTVAKTLGKEFGDTGSCMQEWAGLNDTDYESCTYEIVDNEAKVTVVGKGKFKNLKIVDGTRNSATSIENGSDEVASLPIEWYAGSDTSNLVSAKDEEGNVIYYKISDYADSIDKLEGVTMEFSAGIENIVVKLSTEFNEDYGGSTLRSINENTYCFFEGLIVVNQIPNNEINGIVFPETGMYIISDVAADVSVSIGGKIKTTVIITENSIKWDGNPRGLDCFLEENNMLCKVSDTIPSTNPESYKKLIFYTNNEYKEFVGENGLGQLSDDGKSISILFASVALEDLDDNEITKGVWFIAIKNSESGEIISFTSEIQFESE